MNLYLQDFVTQCSKVSQAYYDAILNDGHVYIVCNIGNEFYQIGEFV